MSDRRILAYVFCSCSIVLVLLSGLPAQAQEGGLGGGGFGGGTGGPIKETDLFTTTNIHTQGESDPWPIAVKDGETLIVWVASSVFDPMVALVGPDGKTLAENDDVRPGVQDSLLLWYCAKGGTYKVMVKSLKSRAGGQYTLSIRRFVAQPTVFGKRHTGRFGPTGLQWHRFDMAVGQTVAVTATGTDGAPSLAFYQPNGETLPGGTREGYGSSRIRAVFRAEQKGTYYARVASGRERESGYAFTAALAREDKTAIGQPAVHRTLQEGGLDIWRFAGKAGQLVQVVVDGPAGTEYAVDRVPEVGAEPAGASRSSATPVAALPSRIKADGEQIDLLNVTGSFSVSIQHATGVAVPYGLKIEMVDRPVPVGGRASGELELGANHYFALQGTAGSVLRVGAAAKQFDAEIEVYSPHGQSIGSNDDGDVDRNAMLTVVLTETGRYLARVHAHGDGGSGAYTLTRYENVVTPLRIGEKATGTVGAGGYGVHSFQSKAGQTFVIALRSAQFSTQAMVYGPDGTRVISGASSGDTNDTILPLRTQQTGTYIVWVSGRDGGGTYTISVIDIP